MRKIAAFAVSLVLLAVASCRRTGVAVPDDAVLANTNADTRSTLTSQNVGQLALLWKATSPTWITHKPLVRENRAYFADWGGTVYAADAQSGQIIWRTHAGTIDPKLPWRGFSGTGALGEGLLFEASVEGTLYAFDLATGSVRWKVRFTDKPVAGNTGALLYWHDIVYVPVSSMDEGFDQRPGFVTDFQGQVKAYDALTGTPVWEFSTVTGSANGAAVWSGFALDPESGLLFFDTGNNYTGAATEMSDAVIAVDALTGIRRWSRQCTANDVWTVAQPAGGPDFDFGAAPQLFTASVNGTTRKLVAAGQKSGTLWVLDQSSGDVVWSAPLGAGAAGGGFLAPAAIGDSAIFAWANNAFRYAEPDAHLMDVAAFELATGRVRWKNVGAQPAAVTTAGFVAGDLYFVGSLDGKVRAYRTSDGTLAWTSDSMESVSASLVVADGRLYVTTGIPSMFGGTGSGGSVYCLGMK